MELKDYQEKVLARLERWHEVLQKKRDESEQALRAISKPSASLRRQIGNYPKTAWEELQAELQRESKRDPYIERQDAAGRPIPHVCLKVPTGGGKTLLAAAATARLAWKTGLVVWVVPSRAIYAQTLQALTTREHPCRVWLERASGGRVHIMQKDDPLQRGQVEHQLCVLLLMLQATNRRVRDREFLRIARDSGRYPTFFPTEDDHAAWQRLGEEHPDLECGERGTDGALVRHSLINVIKRQRPLIILDEAHRAYGGKGAEEYAAAINRLSPRLVLELSATPTVGLSNLLVDVGGRELQREEMIKLPIVVTADDAGDWKVTLARAHEQLKQLGAAASRFEQESGRYVRPMAVVRVERTGPKQRGQGRLHIEDVREYLVRKLAVSPAEVAVKSATQDELAGVDLLSPYCPLRWILTKDALKEGWDCPFAYALVVLDNLRSVKGWTQLVGRVMRQPGAQRTGVEALDRCYVQCISEDVGRIAAQVKEGLDQEGLGDLKHAVSAGGTTSAETGSVELKRREAFRGRRIFLPRVLYREGEEWVPLDYVRHLLAEVDWDRLEVSLQDLRDAAYQQQTVLVDLNRVQPQGAHELSFDAQTETSWFARRLSDVVPNPWQAARWVQRTLAHLDGKRYDAPHRVHLVERLKNCLFEKTTQATKEIFQHKMAEKRIRFDLVVDGKHFEFQQTYTLPGSDSPKEMLQKNGTPMQKSLFCPVGDDETQYNDLERGFALYLDACKTIDWWHRVGARQRDDYVIQGWQKDRIWPDFVAMTKPLDGTTHLLIYETKGEHLQGNDDTRYKEGVLKTLEEAFNCGMMTIAGEGAFRGRFRLVLTKGSFGEALPS